MYRSEQDTIAALKRCANSKIDEEHTRVCKTCPYRDLHGLETRKCYDLLMEDALEIIEGAKANEN